VTSGDHPNAVAPGSLLPEQRCAPLSRTDAVNIEWLRAGLDNKYLLDCRSFMAATGPRSAGVGQPGIYRFPFLVTPS